MLEFLSLNRWIGRARPPVTVVRPRPALDLVTWRKNDTRVAFMADLFKQPLFAEAVMVLQNQIPRGFPARGQIVNETTAAVELGRMQGYMDALGVLYEMATPVNKAVHIEPTYLLDPEPT